MPTAPGQLAHRHPLPGRPQPLHVAVGLERPQGELGAEGGGLGVHPVGPPGHRHVDALEGPGLEGGPGSVAGLDEQVGRPGEGGAQGGVDHVRRGEAVVDPRALGLPDGLLDHVDEGGHVVVGDALALGHRLHEVPRPPVGAPVPAHGGGVGGDVPDLHPTLGGQQLDPQPHGEPGLVGEEIGHGLGGVAGDHRATSFVRDGDGGSDGITRVPGRQSLPGDVGAGLHPGPRWFGHPP